MPASIRRECFVDTIFSLFVIVDSTFAAQAGIFRKKAALISRAASPLHEASSEPPVSYSHLVMQPAAKLALFRATQQLDGVKIALQLPTGLKDGKVK
jgi:hypothetical protein